MQTHPPKDERENGRFQRPSANENGTKDRASRYIETTEGQRNTNFEKIAVVLCWILVVAFFPFSLLACLQVVREHQRLVLLRLGRLKKGALGPGLVFYLPCIDVLHGIDLRTDVTNVRPQDVLTKDSVTITVNAVVYYCIYNPVDSIIQVDDVKQATEMIAQVTLRNVVGSKTLNVLLTSRQALSREIQESVAGITSRWGVLVERVDLMDIILPPTLERSLASEAEAVREARAKIILAEGELSASKALKEASDVMSENQITLQLRHLQILSSIATERRVRIIYPIPMEVMEPFMKNGGGESGGGESGGRAGGGGGQGTMASECAGTSGAASETIGEEVVTSGSGRDGAGVSSADAGVFMSMSKHILPQTPIVEANDRPHYVAVEMEPSRQHYVPYVFPPPETSRPPRSTSEPPASRGRLAFMDLQSYRDFLHTRWQ